MNKIWSLLVLTGLSHTAQAATPESEKQCRAEPTPTWSARSDLSDKNIDIWADSVRLVNNQSAFFSGQVELNSTQMTMTAESAILDKQSGTLSANGPIVFQNPYAIVTSAGFNGKMDNYQVSLTDADYRLIDQQAHGKAELFAIDKNRLLLKGSSFTTCQGEQPFWSIHASDIEISREKGWATTSHTLFKIKDVPVFYLPYFTYPINDNRKSGFLFPTVGGSTRYGVEIKTPFYWNIAPNMDATITPRYMANIGLQLNSEFRYLTENHMGSLALEYLDNDKSESQLSDRYLFHWKQRSQFSDRLSGNIDITGVSDDNYLTDLNSDYAQHTETQLQRLGELIYQGDRWKTELKVQEFQVLGQHENDYGVLPQISFTQLNPFKLSLLDVTLEGEFSHFRKNSLSAKELADNPNEIPIEKAVRIHFEPKARYQVSDYAWTLLSEASLLHTQYKQKGPFSLQQDSPYQEDVKRTLPKIRMYGQLNFERDHAWFLDDGYQTLEPQAQYLYVPEKDQSAIGQFDTTRMQDDFFGLFRDKRYSSIDKIDAANQITLGATTRVFDRNQAERFQLSVGQIFYLSDSAKPQNNQTADETAYDSLFAGETRLHWHPRWYLSAGIQYETNERQLIQSHITLDYKGSDNKLIQLNHRIANNVSNNKIEQLGFFASVPIAEQWQWVASYHRDLENNLSQEYNLGIQYESCCWAVQMNVFRNIETDLNNQLSDTFFSEPRFNSGYKLNFILKGLGSSKSGSATKLLQNGIFNYRRPYFLGN